MYYCSMKCTFAFLLCGGMLFSSCAGTRIHLSPPSDVPLMPYATDLWAEEKQSYLRGYINSETFEVVIPAQYGSAGNFIGDFTVVKKNRDSNKLSIINKQNVEIIRNVHSAYLYASEDGKNVFAFTKKYSGIKKSPYTVDDWLPIPSYDPRYIHYKLYNLTTGKLLLKSRVYFYRDLAWKKPGVMFIDNYMIYADTVYEIMENGDLKETTFAVDDFMTKAMEKRNLHPVENDFYFYFTPSIESSDVSFEPFDTEQLFKKIPDHLVLKRETIMEDGKPVYAIKPINRYDVYPLRKNRLLYEVKFGIREEGEGKAVDRTIMSSEYHFGLWDAVENEWVIYPVQSEFMFSKGFQQTEYAEWVHLDGGGFYNIVTRKKYRKKYDIGARYTSSWNYIDIMAYAGFKDDDNKNEEGEPF